MPAVIRISVEVLEHLLDIPEGVRLQEARIIDDHLELLATGVYRDADGGLVQLHEGAWYQALYYSPQPGVLVLDRFAQIVDDG